MVSQVVMVDHTLQANYIHISLIEDIIMVN